MIPRGRDHKLISFNTFCSFSHGGYSLVAVVFHYCCHADIQSSLYLQIGDKKCWQTIPRTERVFKR